MSQRTLQKQDDASRRGRKEARAQAAAANHTDIPGLLARMTFEERVRAYATRSITRRELTIAAGREPDRMPVINGELEWIALSLADLD